MLEKLKKVLPEARRHAKAGHLPVWRQLADMSLLMASRRIGPGYYFRAGMYRREVPMASKFRYRVGSQYVALLKRFNEPGYRMVLRNKAVEKALLAQFAIPHSPLFGVYHPVSGSDCKGAALRDADSFTTLLRSTPERRMAVKLVEGMEGRGFDIVRDAGQGDSVYSEGRAETLPVAAYLERQLALCPHLGLLLEAVICQHATLAAINSSSVNTLRLWVTQHDDSVRVRSAMLKMGAAGSLVDYTSRGGAAATIDLNTGRIETPRMRRGKPEQAPSSAPQAGFEVPMFSEACELAERCLRVVPGICLAGLDIAITDTGPLVVELNDQPDPGHPALLGIPTLDLLAPIPPRR